jgi:hypothetical protein
MNASGLMGTAPKIYFAPFLNGSFNSKFSKAMPKLLVAAGLGYGIKNVLNTPKEEKKNAIIKNASVLGFTIASALISTRGLCPLKLFKKQIFKGFNGLSDLKLPQKVRQVQSKLVESFLQKDKVGDDILDVLNKSKSKVLKYSEIKIFQAQAKKSSSFNKFFNDLIPEPNFKTSKDIFSEIGRLSLMGLVPVIGGITGGIIGDRLTDANWKEKVPNKIKEVHISILQTFLFSKFRCWRRTLGHGKS